MTFSPSSAGRAVVVELVVVLELALPGLVADGAVHRVIQQEELEHRTLALLHARVLGVDDHPLRHRGLAGRHQLRRVAHLHQAHAAVGGDGEALVVAVVGNVGADLLHRVDHVLAGLGDELLAVDGHGDEPGCFGAACRRARRRRGGLAAGGWCSMPARGPLAVGEEGCSGSARSWRPGGWSANPGAAARSRRASCRRSLTAPPRRRSC